MRVLHVTRYFPPRMGGTERFVSSLVGALAGRGVQSRVVVTNRARSGPGPIPEAALIELPVAGPERLPIIVGGRGRLARAVATADVVHLHDLRFGFHAARRLAGRYGKPVVLSTHGLIFHTAEFSGIKTALWRAYYRPALRRLAAVVAVSPADEAFCRDAGIVANLSTVPNPVDIAPFRDVARHPEIGRLLYFGRFSPNKGLEQLAAVLEADPALTLRLAGRGGDAYTEQLRERFAPLAERVAFVGAPSDEELREELSRCAAAVLPSNHEAFGLTLVEAMAAGVPIVANDIPPYRALATGTDVAIVDFSQAREVVEALRRVTQRYDARPGQQLAADLSWERGIDPYLCVYERVIAHKR